MGAYRDLSAADTHPLIVDSVTNPPDKEPVRDTTIDIRLDDKDAPPLQPLSEQDVPPAYFPDRIDPVRSKPDMTSLGSSHLLVPGALLESGILYNDTQSIYSVQVTQSPKTSVVQASAANAAAPPSSLASASAERVAADSIPSEQDFLAAKPHPSALFLPETLEWRLIAHESELFKQSIQNDRILQVPNLFQACNFADRSVSMYETLPATIPAEGQTLPITLVAPAKQGGPLSEHYLEEFNLHKCWITGKRIISSPPDAIPTVVDRMTLLALQEDRMGSPSAGLSPRETLVRALRVLLRVIGNAVHGEMRPVTTTSTTVTQKLGWDNIAILEQLGWAENKLPDERTVISPPALFADTPEGQTTLKRVLRAWFELSAWLNFHLVELEEEFPRSNLLASTETQTATKVITDQVRPEIYQMFGYLSSNVDPSRRGELPTRTREALYSLGVAQTSTDDLVRLSYLINSEISPSRRMELLSSLEEVFLFQRGDSKTIAELIAYEKSKGRFTYKDIDKAYQRLHLSPEFLGEAVPRENLPQEFIVDNYRARAREALDKNDTVDFTAAKEALKLVSVSLSQPLALEEAHSARIGMDVSQAYTLLEITRDMDDTTLIAVYEIRLVDSPAQRVILEEALHSIAEDRNSHFLRNFLQTGEKGTCEEAGWEQMPSSDRPAGINNIGNTCYLNSVLQYFFTIREIRDRVLQLAAEEPQDVEKRVGGRLVSKREVKRSRRFVLHLAELFTQLIHTQELAVTPERELAYLALVSSRVEEDAEDGVVVEQTLVSDEPAEMSPVKERAPLLPVTETMDESETQPNDMAVDETTKESAPVEPTTPVPERQATIAPPLPPRPRQLTTLPAPARRNSLMQLGAQQDVSECLDNCMFQLEIALTSTSEDLLPRLFVGKTCQQLQLASPENQSVHTKQEIFKILPVDVLEEGRDLYDGLDGFFDEETLIGSSGAPVRRTVTLTEPPPLLQIQLQRVQYDRTTMRAFKSQAHMSMDEKLYIDRYLDFEADDLARLEKRQSSRSKRRRIGELRTRLSLLKSRSIAQTLSQTSQVLSDIAAPGLCEFLLAESKAVTAEQAELEKEVAQLKAETQALWQDEKRVEYTLCAVFMHRGEASHGHYFINQKEVPGDRWFKYNDSVVSAVDLRDVLRDTSGATPYLVTYVRSDLLHLINTVCRSFPSRPSQKKQRTAEA